MQIIEECLLSDIHTVCRFVCVMGINTVQGSEYSVQCKVYPALYDTKYSRSSMQGEFVLS